MLNNPHLSYFLLRKKEERRSRKNKEKPWAGERLQANMGIFRLFPAGKVSTSSKRDIRCDTHLCSHKRDSVTKPHSRNALRALGGWDVLNLSIFALWVGNVSSH